MNPRKARKLPPDYSSIYGKVYEVIALRGKQIRSSFQTSPCEICSHADAIRGIQISADVK